MDTRRLTGSSTLPRPLPLTWTSSPGNRPPPPVARPLHRGTEQTTTGRIRTRAGSRRLGLSRIQVSALIGVKHCAMSRWRPPFTIHDPEKLMGLRVKCGLG